METGKLTFHVPTLETPFLLKLISGPILNEAIGEVKLMQVASNDIMTVRPRFMKRWVRMVLIVWIIKYWNLVLEIWNVLSY